MPEPRHAPFRAGRNRGRIADRIEDSLQILERTFQLEVLIVAGIVDERAVLGRPVRRAKRFRRRSICLKYQAT